MAVDMVSIKKKKGEIEIEELSGTLSGLESLSTEQAPTCPLMLCIDGKGVIHKSFENIEEEEASLVGKMLPNAHPKDFYLQRIKDDDGKWWVSMSRKELIDGILKELSDSGWFIHDLVLGNFNLMTSIPALEKDNIEALNDEENQYQLNDTAITKISAKPEDGAVEKFSVSGKDISTPELIAMGNALQYYVADNRIQRAEYELIPRHTNEFFHKRLFTSAGRAVLGVFMLTLLISFLTFDHYNKKYNEVANEVRQNEVMLYELDELKNELKLKEEFISGSGFVNASHISYYADQLALTLPGSIRLQQLLINPVVKKKNEKEKTTFEFNQIMVSGKTTENLDLNSWIKLIKSKPWAEEVEIVDFAQGKSKNGGSFEFKITVNNKFA